MSKINELSALLFNGTSEDAVNSSVGEQSATKIIYGWAVTDSENGLVTVRLDDAIYALDDSDEEDYTLINIDNDEDDVFNIDDDEELEEPDEEEQIVYWEGEDDAEEVEE